MNNRKLSFLFALLLIGFFVFDSFRSRTPSVTIPYSDFQKKVNSGQIETALLSQTEISGTLKDDKHTRYVVARVDDPTLTQKLQEHSVRFEAVPEHSFLTALVAWTLPTLLMIGFWLFISNRTKGAQSQFLAFGKSKAKIFVEHDLKTKFSDVAGIDEAKGEIEELVHFLKNPKEFGRLGGRMPKGILLVGPPGTGKTLLARAIAGEAQVPFFSINGSEFVELFVGLGAARVRDLFSEARKSTPCIIFIDELDALGKARGIQSITSGSNDEKEQTLNQLLAELDGFDPSQGVVLLAATNRPEVLDPALLRSGRFDRQIPIDKPDKKGRAEILKIHMKKIQLSDSFNIDTIAAITAGFSGADLANLVNEAALVATRRGADSVTEQDCTAAMERIVGGIERKSRVLSASERNRVAYHELGHTTVSLALEKDEAVHKVSIIPRGIGALGYTLRRPIEDRYLMKKGEVEIKLAVLLGGRAAEMLLFNESSTGAADDLDKATEIARKMVTQYGMSKKLGPITYDKELSALLEPRLTSRSHDYSEATAEAIDAEVKSIVETALVTAVNTLNEHRKFLEAAHKELSQLESLDEQQLKDLWSRHLAADQSTLPNNLSNPQMGQTFAP